MKTTLEELRKLDVTKLSQELLEAKKDHFKIKFEVRNGQSKDNHQIKEYRKSMAQIETVIKEKTKK